VHPDVTMGSTLESFLLATRVCLGKMKVVAEWVPVFVLETRLGTAGLRSLELKRSTP
jgi:hypothetical protein